MEKIIDAALGFIQVIAITGAIGLGGAIGVRVLHDKVQKETIEALKKSSPSLWQFSRKLTAPSR